MVTEVETAPTSSKSNPCYIGKAMGGIQVKQMEAPGNSTRQPFSTAGTGQRETADEAPCVD